MQGTIARGAPVIQNGDDLSRFEGELVVLGRLKVVDGAHLASLGLVGGEQAAGAGVEAGEGRLRVQPLLLQRKLNG